MFLLDDPEPYIRSSVLNRLEEIGESAVPLIDQARATTTDKEHREFLTSIIRDLTFDTFQQEIIELTEDGIYTLEDLEDAIFMFSRFENPTIRTKPYVQHLDSLADKVAHQVYKAETDERKLLTLIRFLYTEKKFGGCQSDYLNPSHSYMHQVLTHRKGVPLSLAFIILFVGRRLNLSLHGVNMPLHFLVKYVPGNGEPIFIDPFNQGNIISKEQCNLFLKKSGVKLQDHFFDTAPPLSMFTRFIRNLINGHHELDERKKAEQLSKILTLVETSRMV